MRDVNPLPKLLKLLPAGPGRTLPSFLVRQDCPTKRLEKSFANCNLYASSVCFEQILRGYSVASLFTLKVERAVLTSVKYNLCRQYSIVGAQKQNGVMSTSVLSWDSYFKQNKSRLVDQFQQKYGTKKDKKEVISEINSKVAMWKGDITKMDIDAIVNAANSSLLGGGGVDGAIHRAAGPKLKEECRTLHGCKVGEAKITNGYNLLAKHVIHTVGPQGEKPDLLKSCYNSSLHLLVEKNLRTVAFPCISTGIYGYPQEPAAHIAIGSVRIFLEKNKDAVDQVIFCLFLPEDVAIYENLLQLYFPVE